MKDQKTKIWWWGAEQILHVVLSGSEPTYKGKVVQSHRVRCLGPCHIPDDLVRKLVTV